MTNAIERILIDQDSLTAKVQELAGQISEDYKDKELLLVGILKGSVPFTADLLRFLEADVMVDFMSVSSYGDGAESSGRVRVIKDLDNSVDGKNILIVEDIIDSGNTLYHLKELLLLRNPESVKICTILNKPSRRVKDVKVDYIGFDIEDEFVVGYGLDYAERYRNLPYVGVLKREVYEK